MRWKTSSEYLLRPRRTQTMKTRQQTTLSPKMKHEKHVTARCRLLSLSLQQFHRILGDFHIHSHLQLIGTDVLRFCRAALCCLCIQCEHTLRNNIMRNNHYRFVGCDYDCHLITTASAFLRRIPSILRFFIISILKPTCDTSRRVFFFIFVARGAAACVGVTQFLACSHFFLRLRCKTILRLLVA